MSISENGSFAEYLSHQQGNEKYCWHMMDRRLLYGVKSTREEGNYITYRWNHHNSSVTNTLNKQSHRLKKLTYDYYFFYSGRGRKTLEVAGMCSFFLSE